MRLLHYSDQPLLSVYSAKQDPNDLFKPFGLWVSVEGEDDWAAWCRSESFRDVDNQCVTEVVLRPGHRVLELTNAGMMTTFHETFWVRPGFEWRGEMIDWPRVAEQFQGIVIAPYQWAHRLDGRCSPWYYSWDCASGCIWDADAVAELRPLVAEAA